MSSTASAVTLVQMVRIASVPANHVYVRHLGLEDGSDRVRRLPDPAPD